MSSLTRLWTGMTMKSLKNMKAKIASSLFKEKHIQTPVKFSKTSERIFFSIPVFGFAVGLVGSPKAERINESTESRQSHAEVPKP